jgi:hypothetical protein
MPDNYTMYLCKIIISILNVFSFPVMAFLGHQLCSNRHLLTKVFAASMSLLDCAGKSFLGMKYIKLDSHMKIPLLAGDLCCWA